MRLTLLTAPAAAVAMVLGSAGAALACGHNPPPPTVSVCWQVDDPDQGLFPQTFVAEGDDQQTIDTLCPAPPKCTTVEYQFDLYTLDRSWKRDYLDQLEADGLTIKDGHPADQPLSPHGTATKTVTNPDGCKPPVARDASFKVKRLNGCTPSRRYVQLTHRHHVHVVAHGHNGARTRWHFRVRADRGHAFKDGSHVRRVHVHLKRLHGCHAPGS